MNVVTGNSYLKSLLQGQPQLAKSPLAWLNELRANAVDRAGALTVPTTRDEEWRFTDISPLTKLPLHPAHGAPRAQAAQVERFYLEEAATRLVFIDGVFAPQWSTPASVSSATQSSAQSSTSAVSGVVVTDLSTAISTHAATIESHLGRHIDAQDNVFTALNTAFLHDAAAIIVPRNAMPKGPVHLLFIAAQKEAASYPRALVVVESGGNVTLVEDFVALNNDAYLTNAVTEIALGRNARVNHIRVQRDSGEAFHIANCAVSIGQASHYESVSVALGGRISRYNLNVRQVAEDARCTIDGLALIGERQLADTHTLIDHLKPHGTSRQLHKCVVGGAAHAVFNGKIVVHPGAQQIDSSQSSRNLLLTGTAHVDTKPQLEIFADDVKCTHGATVGQLDDEEVFYLKSRGLSDVVARNLLTYAFAAEIIERIPIASLKRALEETVLDQTQKI